MALEAACLAHEGRVVAVERVPSRALDIQENRRRFGAASVDVCLGTVPQCLPRLPDPHRVFIGGGLSGEGAPPCWNRSAGACCPADGWW